MYMHTGHGNGQPTASKLVKDRQISLQYIAYQALELCFAINITSPVAIYFLAVIR